MSTSLGPDPVDAFNTRWAASEGAEWANFQPFAEHPCENLGVGNPAGSIQFKQRRKIEKRVAHTILALARLGHIATEDGGRTFALRGAG